MKTTLAIIFIMASAVHAFATPPNLDSLSGISFNEFIEDQDWDEKRVLLFVDESEPDRQLWEGSVWNDPEMVEFLKEQGVVVIWIDPDEDEHYFNMFKSNDLPCIRYGISKNQNHIRNGIDPEETTSYMIEWLTPAINHSSYIKELGEKIHLDPNDHGSRWKVLNEYRKQMSYSYARALAYENLLPLLDQNQEWYEYIHANEGMDEQEFLVTLVQIIGEYRTATYLFGEPEDDSKSRFIRSGWKGAIEYTDLDGRSFNWGKGVMHRVRAVRFLREFEIRCDSETATERDLFILKALTAEGEEWEAMIKEYSGNTP
jgi:hypothetical protein